MINQCWAALCDETEQTEIDLLESEWREDVCRFIERNFAFDGSTFTVAMSPVTLKCWRDWTMFECMESPPMCPRVHIYKPDGLNRDQLRRWNDFKATCDEYSHLMPITAKILRGLDASMAAQAKEKPKKPPTGVVSHFIGFLLDVDNEKSATGKIERLDDISCYDSSRSVLARVFICSRRAHTRYNKAAVEFTVEMMYEMFVMAAKAVMGADDDQAAKIAEHAVEKARASVIPLMDSFATMVRVAVNVHYALPIALFCSGASDCTLQLIGEDFFVNTFAEAWRAFERLAKPVDSALRALLDLYIDCFDALVFVCELYCRGMAALGRLFEAIFVGIANAVLYVLIVAIGCLLDILRSVWILTLTSFFLSFAAGLWHKQYLKSMLKMLAELGNIVVWDGKGRLFPAAKAVVEHPRSCECLGCATDVRVDDLPVDPPVVSFEYPRFAYPKPVVEEPTKWASCSSTLDDSLYVAKATLKPVAKVTPPAAPVEEASSAAPVEVTPPAAPVEEASLAAPVEVTPAAAPVELPAEPSALRALFEKEVAKQEAKSLASEELFKQTMEAHNTYLKLVGEFQLAQAAERF